MPDDSIKEALDAFDECVEAERDNRESYLEDVRFARLGEQWPETLKRARELEGRPVLTVNKLNASIRQVVNDARQNKPQIKTHPVDDGADKETAKVIDGLIRNIEATSDADVAYDTAVECAISGGFGYWAVNVSPATDDSFQSDLAIRRVLNPLSIYGDPRSTAADSSDWDVAFQVERIKRTAFERIYPGAKATDWSGTDWQQAKIPWRGDDDVMVAAYWTREEVTRKIVGLSDGQVMDADEFEKIKDALAAQGITPNTDIRPVISHKVTQRLMTACEELKKTDWVGKYIPIVPVYGDEVNVEGKRVFRSLIADAKDPARMFNYWRTTATEMVALAPRVPFIGRKGAFETDAVKWATANSTSHPYIEYDGPEAPQRQGLPQAAMAAIQEAANAADDIKAVTGIYDASLGARSNETSGKAIMARQREGDVSTFHFIDNVSRSIRHTGRILIDLIPKVYNTERVIRVLGQDGESEPRKVNAPYEVKGAKQGQDGNEIAAETALHDLTVGKYDLTVTSGPSFTSRREEAAQQMMELVRSFPDAAPLIGDILAKNLDWPGADEIAERLKTLSPAAKDDEAAPDPEKAQMQQAIQAGMQHIQELTRQIEDQSGKLEIDKYNAETNRLKVTAPAMGPEDIRAVVMQTIADLLSGNELQPEQAEAPYAGSTGMMPEPEQMAVQ